METRSNRQRLMMVSSYVSPPRPDLPATFESLNDDTLTTVLEFVGKRSYKSFGVNKRCREVYLNTPGMTKETFLFGYGPLSVIKDRYERLDEDGLEKLGKGVVFYNRKDVLEWAFEERDTYLLSEICFEAVREERFDLLNKVWNNTNNEDNEEIFEEMDFTAASCGKLNVLKWVETKGLSINKESCAIEAAEGGQLHILKWLQEEKGLELKKYLYIHALHDGGQLHIVKWLREQEVPWSYYSFKVATKEGNLDILQWLHDEGCPWPYSVDEEGLKPEVIDWCRMNGYDDRIDRIML